MTITSYHFKSCGFPTSGCICASIQRSIESGACEDQPRDDIRIYEVRTMEQPTKAVDHELPLAGEKGYQVKHYKDCPFPIEGCDCDVIERPAEWTRHRVAKQPCQILDYAAPGAPVPGAPVVPTDLEGSNSPGSVSPRKTGKSDMQREAILPRHYQRAAVLDVVRNSTADVLKEECCNMLARLFPGADLRYAGPHIHINQEAPPQNRYTAHFGFPYGRIIGRGPDELDALQMLFTNMHAKLDSAPTPELSFAQLYIKGLVQAPERDDPEAIIPLAELEKAREEAAAALAPEDVQDEKKYIEFTAGWPAPEVGPLVQVGSISYDDSALGDAPAPDVYAATDDQGNTKIDVTYTLPQGNPEFVRGYEFVAGSYSFVCTPSSVTAAARIDKAFGNWYPLVRLEAYEKLQETVRNLTANLATEQQETAAAEERAEKFRQEVVSLRVKDDPNGLPLATLTAGLQATLAGYGQIIVQAHLHSRYRKAEAQRDYLASQSLIVLWDAGLPYVAKINNDGQIRGIMETEAVCGYDGFVPITFENVETAIDQAMRILPPVEVES